MKWFKLDCRFQDTLEIRELIAEWGMCGYGWLLTIYAKVGALVDEKRQTFDLTMPDGRPFPLRLLSKDLSTTVKRLSDFCGFLSAKGLIDTEAWRSKNRILVPQMAEWGHEYIRKVRKKSGQTPAQEQEGETEGEGERESEEEKNKNGDGLRRGGNSSDGEPLLNLNEEEFQRWKGDIHRMIAAENASRPHNRFEWIPTASSQEVDFRMLLSALNDEDKLDILARARNALGDQGGWPQYVRLWILYTVKSSDKKRVEAPYKYIRTMLRFPEILAGEMKDGKLAGSSSGTRRKSNGTKNISGECDEFARQASQAMGG
ncbi:MAG: hypothetical protein WBH56_08775 [Bacteroidota bacterium]